MAVEWERDSADYWFTHGEHPRTGVAIDQDGQVIFATMDGRTAAGQGVDLFDFSQWLVWLGARDALNLDGGGSTTLWVQTEGVVNYPSDNGTSDHYGERVVSNALGVFSTPLERATEWLAPPGTQTISLTESATLEVFARDPDGLHLDLLANHNGHGVLNLFDRGDGSAFVTYEPDINDRGTVTLIIEAYTSQGLDGQIQFELMVHNEGDDPEEPTSNEPERSNDADMLSEEESDAELPETDHPEDASAPSLDEDISRSDYGYTSTGR